MELRVPKAAAPNPLLILRKAGYSYFVDPVTKEESFVLRTTAAFYPRFHVYVTQDDRSTTFTLHLDQKQPTYGDGHTHGGEYDGPAVERECKRIESWISACMREQRKEEKLAPKPKTAIKKWTDWFWT